MPISMTPYRVFDSYRSITPAFFMRHGIRLLLCDLDYTLAPKSQPEPDADLRRWLSDVRAAGVEVGQRVAHLANPRHCLGLAERPAALGQQNGQALALDIVHHQVLPLVGYDEVIDDARQVRVAQPSQ